MTMPCPPRLFFSACWVRLLAGAVLLGVLGLGPTTATAQQMETMATPAPRVTTDVIWQSYQLPDDTALRQVSTSISARVPVGSRTVVSVRANTALTDGSNAAAFAGVGDIRLGATTRLPLGDGQVVLGLRSTLPVGTTQWDPDRFRTIVRVSRDHLRFHTPVYGQGFSIAPSIMYARPLSDRMTAGVGVRYQVRGSYEPFANMADPFEPGNDMSVTGGLDLQLSRHWFISMDALYTWYEEDSVGETPFFSSGNQLIAGVALAGELGDDAMQLRFRYRERGRPSVPQAGGDAVPALRTVSDYVSALGTYRWRPAPPVTLEAQLGGRWYGASDVTEELRLVDVSLAPSLRVMEDVQVRSRLTYTAGTFEGLEVGFGLVAWLR